MLSNSFEHLRDSELQRSDQSEQHQNCHEYGCTHVGPSVHGAVLCDGGKSGLMVGRRVDASNTILASRQATGDVRGKNATLSNAIQALEE